MQTVQMGGDLGLASRIETGQRLVEEQQARLGEQGPRQRIISAATSQEIRRMLTRVITKGTGATLNASTLLQEHRRNATGFFVCSHEFHRY